MNSRIAPEWLAVTGFVYVEGLSDSDAIQTLLFERVAKQGGRNVVIGAGTVEWVAELDLQKRLETQKEKKSAAPVISAPAAATPPSSNP
jgi:hypothetical protein